MGFNFAMQGARRSIQQACMHVSLSKIEFFERQESKRKIKKLKGDWALRILLLRVIWKILLLLLLLMICIINYEQYVIHNM